MSGFLGLTPFTICVLMILVFSLSGLPIGLSMLGASVVYLMVSGQDMGLAAEQILQGLTNSYTLLAIPLFILASELMNLGSLSDRLLAWCNALVGRFRGGMGHVNVVSSLIFSGMSGSAIADVVGVGKLTMDMMTKNGRYTPAYSAAITAATAVIGPIIPPSIPLVLYALISDTSIGYLFAAGVVPGLIMTLVMMALNGYLAHKRNFPVEPAVPMREFFPLTFKALPALMMPVVLLGGIYSGVMTPTEAAGVAALYTLVLGLLYRSLTLKTLVGSVINASVGTAVVMLMVGVSMTMSWLLASTGSVQMLAEAIIAFSDNPYVLMMLFNVLLLLLGTFLDITPGLLIFTPIFLPVAMKLGISPVHFGIIITFNLCIGIATPPVGSTLFVSARVAKVPLSQLTMPLLPMFALEIIALFLVTYIPALSLWLPQVVLGKVG